MKASNSGNATSESPLKGKKWFAVGDSITEAIVNTTKGYHAYVADATGCIVTKNGAGGTGWEAVWPLRDRVANWGTDYDIITIFLGTNDWKDDPADFALGTLGDTTNATFYGCIDEALNLVIAKYPTKKIAVFTPLPSANGLNNSQGQLEQIADAIKEVAAKKSIPCLDLFRNSNLNVLNATAVAAYIPDGLHPNEAGHQWIAYKIQKFLESI
jgi:hypothetical protein